MPELPPTPAQLETDTIVAVATPPGRGGVGIVRLSGPVAVAIGLRIVPLPAPPVPRHAHYGFVVDAEGRRLDDALFTWFAAPASYTGEDVVEVGTHGAPVVLQSVVDAALRMGARLARPGEFTERAYFSGKLDLTAAEAVRDLIDAQTMEQAFLAAQQMGGSLAREVAPVKRGLLALIAALEAGIDFAEDDLDTLSAEEIAARIAPLLPPLRLLEGSFARGRLLREGVKLAIVGKPNAGKSSLFNRLLGRDRAIVTPIAGTTRDVIGEQLVLNGVPIHLLDTAGLRETEDEVERQGVARSREAIAEADLILHLVDATEAESPAAETLEGAAASALRVGTKADLLSSAARAALFSSNAVLRASAVSELDETYIAGSVAAAGSDEKQATFPSEQAAPNLLLTSAHTGEGFDALREAITRRVAPEDLTSANAALSNLRQYGAVRAAVTTLDRSQLTAQQGLPHEMVLLDLYGALSALDELTGTTTNDDVLHLIFSTFCIGK